MWDFLKRHYKAIGSVVCGVAASGLGAALGDDVQSVAVAGCAALGLTAGVEYATGKTVGDMVRSWLPSKKPPAK